MSHRLAVIALALAVPFAAACGKKKDGTASDKPAEGSGESAPAGPRTMTAQALFDDFNAPGNDAMALLDKYKPGVIVTGTVTNTIAEESGFLHVWVDGGAGHKVTLDFTDEGAAAKQKGVKAGDAIKAQCKVGGSDGSMMMLIECALN